MHTLRLTPEDAERFRAIRLAALLDAPDAFGSTHEETAQRPPESWRGQLAALPTFLVVLNDADVGVVRVAPLDGAPAIAILLSMWVAADARGQGVGNALMDAAIGYARGTGYRQMVLDVADDNAPAIALYARHGFEPTGETSSLPSPREHILEHRRVLVL